MEKVKEKKVEKSDPLSSKCKDYGLNIGESIKKWFQLNPETTIVSVAKKLKISKVGFYHRINLPYYGNTVDLIEISLLLKHDFISPLLNIYKNKGNNVEISYTESEVLSLKNELEKTKDLLVRSQREADRLHEILDSHKKA
ncbi:MAG: hypothetical protein IPO85_11960 [Saprospiraceae bacterium]|uniref:Uncharacterized protein n=1 Tax=Candidatus Defluviibacterium haderslevense TaxID=2981993 RepID=A0A9D7SBK5_9BACT|nr:hypothetical protein [Candidatus Defluviibacterium haderslevense]